MSEIINILPDGVVSTSEKQKISIPDSLTISGYLLLAVSAVLYAIEETTVVTAGIRTDSLDLKIFFLHYLIAFSYGVTLLFSRSYAKLTLAWSRESIHKTIIAQNLFLISAYALNRELPVFAESTTWLSIHLVITSIVMLTYPYLEVVPKYLRYLHHILLGSSLVLFLYMTVYVANFYLLGMVGIIFFGIGAHAFVPAFFLVTLIRLTVITHKEKKIGTGWIYLGAAIILCVSMIFIGEWKSRTREINRIANQSVIYSDTDLPTWIKVAKTMKNDWFTRLIIKSDLGYSVSYLHHWRSFDFDRDWDERMLHDPLVFLASGEITSLTSEDRKNILKVFDDGRHKAQDRLWSGADLTTAYIVTDVDIYPALRLAYSEQYINVRNSSKWDTNQQEAIYTFQLPEGSVVTSLSLWINGIEEKAILTSKQKATEAYTTIVGRERRDPSVVQWQEGNTVSVRVFPCTPNEERKFKIGVTSPLSVVDGKVIYTNVLFKGPSSVDAQQTSRIRIMGGAKNIDLPGDFKMNVKREYVREGNYDPDLRIEMDSKPVQQNQFSFDGYTYSMSNLKHTTENASFDEIYLDINNSWNPVDLYDLKPVLEGRKVYAYVNDEFVRITKENLHDIVDELDNMNFSLFPFHRLKNTGKALVITKGNDLSPQLLDFKQSKFSEGMAKHLGSGKKAYVFDLENETAPYIRSLRELRAFKYSHGNIKELITILNERKFPIAEESDAKVVLHDSDMAIERTPTTNSQKGNAPDHLARLFAYNDIMRKVGTDFFKDNFVNDDLVKEATSAYVVSPVSSLIVLETQKDYDRFGIEDMNNSLHNATKNSSGAVPEPHEWALILIFLGFAAFQVYKYFKSRSMLAQQ